MIIDAHMHLPAFPKGDLKAKKEALLKHLSLHKIAYALVIPDNTKNTTIGTLDECLELFKDTPFVYIMGTLSVLHDDIEAMIDKLDKLLEEKKIVAIKIFPGHDPHKANDARLYPVFELLLKHQAPLVIHTGGRDQQYNNPMLVVDIAKRFPKLKIIVAHYFYPDVMDAFTLTKSYKNIYFDTSALADNEVLEMTNLENMKRVLKETIDLDCSKVIFGTDYAMCSTSDHVELIQSLKLSPTQRNHVFFKNAIKHYALPINAKDSDID